MMIARRLVAIGAAIVLTTSGCAFQGLNSIALPGAVGRGSDANVYRIEIANVSTLEPNSPVLIDDVVVGSVKSMTVRDWHASVEVSVQPDVVVPANAVASIGQTSLLGSLHVALDPPVGVPPSGRLQPGATVGLNRSSVYPSTEQTLSSLSAVVNAGGLGQIGDIIHDFNLALSGRQPQVRSLLERLDRFVGTLDAQRDNLIATVAALNRFAGTLAEQNGVIANALRRIPPALEVLIKEKPNLVTALDRLRVFSDTANGLLTDTQDYLVRDLKNLQVVLNAFADAAPDLVPGLKAAMTYPFSQDFIDRGYRGDYVNLFVTLDFTIPRLKSTLFLGTRFGQEGAPLVPAPGDPAAVRYTFDPLGVGVPRPPNEFAPPVGLNPEIVPPDAPPPAVAPDLPPGDPAAPVAPIPSPEQGAPQLGGGN